MANTIQTETSPALAVGGRKITLHGLCTGNGTGTPTADGRNRGIVFTRTAKGVVRATLSQTGTIYPMSVQIRTLHVPTGTVRVAGAIKALDAAGGTLDIDVINEAIPAVLQTTKAADAAANTATAETVVLQVPAACTVAAVDILPTGALTAHDTDNAVITVKGYTAAGASGVTVASMTTNLASGNWTAFVKKALTLSGTPANLDREADSVLSITITKGGAGVQIPAIVLRVTFDRHIDLTSSEKIYVTLTINEMSSV